MTIITHYPELPGFQKEPRELVYAMIESGWTGRMTAKGHWIGKAPDGATTTVQAKVGDRRGLKNAKAFFARWLKKQMPPEDQALLERIVTDPTVTELTGETIVAGLAKRNSKRLYEKKLDREAEELYNDMKEGLVSNVTIEPLVRPWLARKVSKQEGGIRYESSAVLERIWPDGKTDYQCAFAGCQFTGEKPRSVANHYGAKHTAQGESEPAPEGPQHIDPTYTEPVTQRDYRPTQRLVDALASWLSENSWDNTDDLAILMLQWAHERPDIEHMERPLIPLSDKQILDKIRLLVGQPDQTAQIDQLQAELKDARATIERLREDKRALRDLLSEEE